MECPPDAIILYGTSGCYPEDCPTPNICYVDKNDPETEVDDAPSKDASPNEPPVPQTVLPVVTEPLVSEEKVPLLVDSSPPAEEALTCAAYNAPALAEAVSSITTSAPPFVISLPLAPRDLANKRLHAPTLTGGASDTPALAEVAAPFGP